MAQNVCLYFQVHQPNRIRKYSFFDIGKSPFYEDDQQNKEVLDKVSDKCYIPSNEMLLNVIRESRGKVKVAFSLSGVFLEQIQAHRPDVLASFQELVKTGSVEILAETYYHSLAYFYSKTEFLAQVEKHNRLVQELFGVKPKVFRNTELLYNNEISAYLEELQYDGVIAEGVDSLLNGRTPNQLYKAPNASLKVLTRNCKLSDDVAFRFSDANWPEYPLTSEKYMSWVKESGGDVANIFIDYETIGEHHWADSGIFQFWSTFLSRSFSEGIIFQTPSEVVAKHEVRDVYDAHGITSWADSEKDLTAWVSNSMEFEAINKIYRIRDAVRQSENKGLVHVWRKLQTSDHFYYMSTKDASDGEVHNYFSPFDTPFDAYIYFMNILSDIEIRLEKEGIKVKDMLRAPENWVKYV